MNSYIVVDGYKKDEFEKKVNEKIKDGYLPIGGISTIKGKWADMGAYYFYQAMVLNTPMLLKCPDCGYQMEEIVKEGLFSCTNEDCCNEIETLKDNA